MACFFFLSLFFFKKKIILVGGMGRGHTFKLVKTSETPQAFVYREALARPCE